MFHGQKFLDKIDKDARSRYVSYECGHYPMHAFPYEMTQQIESFLQET